MRTFSILLAALLLSLLGTTMALQPRALAAAPADIHTVDTCTESTVKAAIASASSGDTVWLRCSSSLSPAVISMGSNLMITKALTLRGDHPTGAYNTLDTMFASPVIRVNADRALTLTQIILQRGQASATGGGCVQVLGTLTAISTTMQQCKTISDLPGGAVYGGITATLSLQNSNLVGNTADGDGGGLYANGSVVTISGGRIEKNAAGGAGGGLYLLATLPVISGARIISNTAWSSGGILSVDSPLLLISSVVSGNVSFGLGGGLAFGGSENGQVYGTAFTANHAATFGGGMYNSGLLTVEGSGFAANVAGFDGGGAYNGGTLELERTTFHGNDGGMGGGLANAGVIDRGVNLTFTQNTASTGGGLNGVPGANARTLLTDVLFAENSALEGGGGVAATGSSLISLHRATISDNYSQKRGGGFYGNGGNITISLSTIDGNAALTRNGGGLHITGTATLDLRESQITANKMTGSAGVGGGLYMYRGTADLSRVVVSDNGVPADGFGGGLYLESVTANLASLTVTGNNGGISGGGIYAHHGNLWIGDSHLLRNVASNGGGLFATQGEVDLWRTTISDHTFAAGYGSGAYYDSTGGTWWDVTVRDNASMYFGGGLYALLSQLEIQRSIFEGNVASVGGGIASDRSTVSLVNSTFSANRAGSNGGGIYNSAQVNMTLLNLTLKDNSALAGGAFWALNSVQSHVFVTNTVFADSPSGGNCGGMLFDSSKYSLSTDLTCGLAGTGNQQGVAARLTPLAFLGGPTRVHLPRADSPLLSMIIGSDFPGMDQRGLPRPVGLAADVGSVERQLADPPYPPLVYLPVVSRQ